jgi:hypothetical protein
MPLANRTLMARKSPFSMRKDEHTIHTWGGFHCQFEFLEGRGYCIRYPYLIIDQYQQTVCSDS